MIFDCPILFDQTTSRLSHRPSEDYLSSSHSISLQLIQPPASISDYDDRYHQFQLFFTTFTPKLLVDTEVPICPSDHLVDCDDAYCVHANARCNNIDECRSRIDEAFCDRPTSYGRSTHRVASWTIRLICIRTLLSIVVAVGKAFDTRSHS